jgi:DNA polymerase-3 subunit alpha
MNTLDFVSQFSTIESPIKGVRLPEIKIEERHRKDLGLGEDCSNFDFLRSLCKKGFLALGHAKGSKEYKDYSTRVKYELDTINDLGLVDYILLVWDVVNFCREQNIPTGPGRGSAAGSLVLFLIGVTKIDSLKNELYFERFISKTRSKKTVIDGIIYLAGSLLMDVDIDFDYYQRSKVIDYINQKYKGKTSKILTLNTLSAKLCIKEVGKVLGMKPEEEMTMVTGFIPKNHGIIMDMKEAYETSPEFKEWCSKNSLIYDTALKLKDLIKNKGVHPSGILISFDKLEDCCPTELSSDKEEVSSYDMGWVAEFAVKLDALGLRSVSVIDDCCKSLGIKPQDINVNEESIYLHLQDLKYPHGVFQIEAETNFKVAKKVKPKNLSEISAVLAIARPGALQFADNFANYSNTGTVDSIHPFFDDVLRETGGLCLYQEQAMKMANKIGFTLDESEQIRRCIGKKKIEEIKTWKAKIEEKVKENKLPKEVGEVFWKIVEDSGGYQFNKSHSFSYSVLCAQTVYLKFNHPTQFYLSLLKMTRHEPDPIGEISKIHKEMNALKVELLPPSLTLSEVDFSIEGKNIRFGLSSIRGISEKTIEKFNNFKRRHSNKFELFESSKEAGLGIGVLSALIQAGTLDSLSNNRPLLVYEAQLWNILTDKEKRHVINYANNYENSVSKTVKALVDTIKDEKGKNLIKASRFETIKKHSEKYKLIYLQNKGCMDFANWWYENKLIGYTHGKKLIDIFLSKKETLEPIVDIQGYGEKTKCDFIGVLEEAPKTGKTKNGNTYARFQISDETGSLKVMIFKDKLEQCKSLNNGLPKEGDIVIVCGTKMEDDCVFADIIATQQNKIYSKLAELKES